MAIRDWPIRGCKDARQTTAAGQMSMNGIAGSPTMRSSFSIMVILALLAILAYLPVLRQPFISDDYFNILLSRTYGPASGWGAMMADHVARVRATSWILTYWIDRVCGFAPPGFYAISILLHVLNKIGR